VEIVTENETAVKDQDLLFVIEAQS
jgi:hypothetical protein